MATYDQVLGFARNLIKNNPQLANHKNSKAMIDAIMNGDATKGQEIANNLCNTYGVKPEDAVNMAMQRFGIDGKK